MAKILHYLKTVASFGTKLPREKFNPNTNTWVEIPSPLPKHSAAEGEYEAILRTTAWGQRILSSIHGYDAAKMKNRHYARLPAKEVVMAYYRCPLSSRHRVVDALIRANVVVSCIDPTSYPKEWEIDAANVLPVKSFSRPVIAVQPFPFVEGIVYVFTDASFEKSSKAGELGKAGIGYMIIHNDKIADEGTGQIAVIDSHAAELEGINLGMGALHVYLAKLGFLGRRGVKGVCICNDSESALGQTRGTASFEKLSAAYKEILWRSYGTMSCFKVFYFLKIPRELNLVADFLAKFALQKSKKSGTRNNNRGTRWTCMQFLLVDTDRYFR